MELRHLRYFVAVAEELNYSRASRRLHISQPSLSNQVKQLEGELGVKLFERLGRGIRLTEAGELFLEEVQRMFAQLEQTIRFVRETGHGEVGRLSIGFIPAASNDVLPPILREFGKLSPRVELFLHEMMPGLVVQRLYDGRIDVAFVYLPFEDDTVQRRVIRTEPLLVALPETHALASEPTVEMQALADEPFILPSQYSTPSLYGKVTELCRRSGFTPKAVQKDVGLMQTIVGLVAGEIGVALVPASLQNLNRKGVVYKEVRGLWPTVEMGVVWRRNNTMPVLASFLDVVTASAEGNRTSSTASLETNLPAFAARAQTLRDSF